MNQNNKITTINIENIPCYCSIGIHKEERKMGQQLLISISLDINSSKLVQTDDINDTVSYVDVYKTIQKIGENSYSLIETLGEKIAESLLKNFSVAKVRVKVQKPHIPFAGFQGDVSVDIVREK